MGADVKDDKSNQKLKTTELPKPGDDQSKNDGVASGKAPLNLLSITGSTSAGESRKNETTAEQPKSLPFDDPFNSSEQQTDRANTRELPPGSVERLNDRLEEMLVQRHKAFNINNAQQELQFQKSRELDLRVDVDMACEKLKIPLRDTEFNSDIDVPGHMRKLLKGHPKALKQYEQYAKNIDAQGRLRHDIDNEFSERRGGIETIINQEGTVLFPDSTMAPFKVCPTAIGSKSKGTYSIRTGELALQDELLMPGSAGGKSLTHVVLHEMKHAEQSGLIVRKMIDDSIPEGSSADKLTVAQKAAVQKELQEQFGYEVDDKIIDSVFSKRAGRRLGADDRERAEALIASEKDLITSRKLSTSEARIKSIEYFLDRYERLDSMDKASSTEYIRLMFDNNIPESVSRAIEQMSSIENPTLMDRTSLAMVVGTELKAQLRAEIKVSLQTYSAYRSRLHEREAFDTAQAGDVRLDQAKNRDQFLTQAPDSLRIADDSPGAAGQTTDSGGLRSVPDEVRRRLFERLFDDNALRRSRLTREVKAEMEQEKGGSGSGAIAPIAILISTALNSFLKDQATLERYAVPTQ